VQQLPVSSGGFEGMADGVSEVEDAAQIGLFLVCRNDARFDLHSAFDEARNRPRDHLQ
jgi:hypothetical protein